ncbi:unnamed protein product [Linum trigynum]|uniref:Secreted protein n=1 Tax=Linum trigynum TaxID=586398 RepID=A0AAV2EXW1_9ROSI
MPWAGFFATLDWLLWKNRCTTTFKGAATALGPDSFDHSQGQVVVCSVDSARLGTGKSTAERDPHHCQHRLDIPARGLDDFEC